MNHCFFGIKRQVRGPFIEGAFYYTLTQDFNAIPEELWNNLNHEDNLFLSKDYLGATSAHFPQKLFFAIFYQENQAVGIAVFHETYFVSGDLKGHVDALPRMNLLSTLFCTTTSKYPVLVCGNPFCTGEHGYSFVPSLTEAARMNALCFALNDVVKMVQHDRRKVSAILVKDFYPAEYPALNELKSCGFHLMQVDNQWLMPIDSAWLSREDYLASLNTKFRTKAKAALKRSEVLVAQDLSAEEMEGVKSQLDVLYRNVYNKAQFAMEPIPIDLVIEWKRVLGNAAICRVYKQDEAIVGFLFAIQNHKELEAFMVGIDYRVNIELSLYSRLLLDFISLAIETKKMRVAFGRTAGEIKSTFGAVPVEMKLAIRHPGTVRNKLISPIFHHVHPELEPQRYPFKQEWQSELDAMQAQWNTGHPA